MVYVSDWPGVTLPTADVMLDPPALSTLLIVRLQTAGGAAIWKTEGAM